MSELINPCGAVDKILEKVVDRILDAVIKQVVHHTGYIVHYKKNLKDLEAEMTILEKKRGKIEKKLNEATTRGEDIEADDLDWKTVAEEIKREFDKFMQDKIVKENMQCFTLSCPNFISRYQLSKKAKNKIGDVKNHSDSYPADYLSCASLASVFKSFMEALKDIKVNMIGLHGPGGVGKTKMVEEVSKQVRKDGLFDKVMVVIFSHDANLSEIQGQIADSLNLKLDAETEVGRANQLRNRLNNEKKNLIILDDIWQELNLKAIGIPTADGNKGCKVVLTSQNQSVFENMKVDRDFGIQALSEPEAWGLFKQQVGSSVDSSKLHSVAVAVCKECEGLPVAILAVGAALKGKDKNAWKNALNQLKKSMLKNIDEIDPKMYSTLKLSYDCLEPKHAKSCFLLCCLFPKNAEISIDDLVRHCIARRLLDQNPDYTFEEARQRVLALVDTLKTRCLLLDSTNKNVVKMHDLIWRVAISIAKEDEAFMVRHGVQEYVDTMSLEVQKAMWDRCSAISLRSKNIQEFPDGLVCPNLHTLLLECSNPLLKVPGEFFSEMVPSLLTALQLDGISMLPLPSSLARLVNLRMLCLINCKLEGIDILENLKNSLEILSLQGSDFEELPQEIGELTHLRLLDLRNCYKLIVIPPGVISNLTRLEELYTQVFFDKSRAQTATKESSTVSLFELELLTELTTLHIHVPHVMPLPKNLHFENLNRFTISVGHTFYNKEPFSSERILKLAGVPLRDEFNNLFDRAEILYLYGLEDLNKVPHDRDGQGFLDLKYLEVRACQGLEHLLGKPRLNSSGSFSKLTELKIRDCRLKYLFSPSCAKVLLQLRRLEICHCQIMEEIVGSEDETYEEELTNKVNFSRLERMKLWGLPNLISFYPKVAKTTETEGNSSAHAQSLFNEKVAFPALKQLEIINMPNITEIWDKELLPTESFSQLHRVKVWICHKLVNVFPSNMLPQLRNLKSLFVSSCQKMEEVIVSEKWEEYKEEANDNIIIFPQLWNLSLQYLDNLKSFCTSTSETQPLFKHQVAFPALEKLEINNVPNITEIWDKKLLSNESFCKLNIMQVWYCHKLVNVVPSNILPQLQNLKLLSIKNCRKMEVIVSEEGGEEEANNDILFPQLSSLELIRLDNLKSFCTSRSKAEHFFNHQVAFPKLENLFLMECVNSREINLWNVLAGKPSSRLQNLRKLIVRNCHGVREVFHLEEGQHVWPITEVRMMELDSLPQLTCLWNKDIPHELILGGLQNLKYLVIKNCSLLRNLFTPSFAMALERLEVLYLKSCTMMEEVIVTNEAQGHKEVTDIEIVFPKLKWLILINLPNLTSFCNANYNFNLPSLYRVVLKRCPKMQTFTSGLVLMPQIFVSTRGNEGLQIKDLNEYLEQRLEEDDNGKKGEEERFSYLDNCHDYN